MIFQVDALAVQVAQAVFQLLGLTAQAGQLVGQRGGIGTVFAAGQGLQAVAPFSWPLTLACSALAAMNCSCACTRACSAAWRASPAATSAALSLATSCKVS
jgi:hypothetical protein